MLLLLLPVIKPPCGTIRNFFGSSDYGGNRNSGLKKWAVYCIPARLNDWEWHAVTWNLMFISNKSKTEPHSCRCSCSVFLNVSHASPEIVCLWNVRGGGRIVTPRKSHLFFFCFCPQRWSNRPTLSELSITANPSVTLTVLESLRLELLLLYKRTAGW